MSDPSPNRFPRWDTLLIVALQAALFAFAFPAAPHGCAWGTDAYLYAAMAVTGLSVLIPLGVPGRVWWRRLVHAFGFFALAVAVTLLGMELAGMPFLCF